MAKRLNFVCFRLAEICVKLTPVFFVAACATLPTSGPSQHAIVEGATNKSVSTASEQEPDLLPYKLVSVKAAVDSGVGKANWAREFSPRLRAGRNLPALIAVGDSLQMVLWENIDPGLLAAAGARSTAVSLTVDTNGLVNAPYIGEIKASGRSLNSVRSDMIERYKQQIPTPDITLTKVEDSSRTASILGDVSSNRVIDVPLGGISLVEAIAQAGGPKKPAWEVDVHLTRKGLRENVSMADIFRNSKNNVAIQPGDIVRVEHKPRQFTVMGSVKSPGATQVATEDVTILGLLAAAGGLDSTSADPQSVFVYRDNKGRNPVIYALDLSRPDSLFLGGRFHVKPTDVTYVGTADAVTLNRFFRLVFAPLQAAVGSGS